MELGEINTHLEAVAEAGQVLQFVFILFLLLSPLEWIFVAAAAGEINKLEISLSMPGFPPLDSIIWLWMLTRTRIKYLPLARITTM